MSGIGHLDDCLLQTGKTINRVYSRLCCGRKDNGDKCYKHPASLGCVYTSLDETLAYCSDCYRIQCIKRGWNYQVSRCCNFQLKPRLSTEKLGDITPSLARYHVGPLSDNHFHQDLLHEEVYRDLQTRSEYIRDRILVDKIVNDALVDSIRRSAFESGPEAYDVHQISSDESESDSEPDDDESDNDSEEDYNSDDYETMVKRGRRKIDMDNHKLTRYDVSSFSSDSVSTDLIPNPPTPPRRKRLHSKAELSQRPLKRRRIVSPPTPTTEQFDNISDVDIDFIPL